MRRALTLLLLALSIVGMAAAGTAQAQDSPLRVRKDVKDLTAQEKSDFVNAVLQLKQTPSPWNSKLSYYDQFVYWHNLAFKCNINAAHMLPEFLPWHRELVMLFENALRQVSGKDITVPYWNWPDPASTAAVFSSDFMGGPGNPRQGYAVTTGPFRKGQWRLNVVDPKSNDAYRFRYLVRRFGTKLGATLPTQAEVQAGLSRPYYDVKPFDPTSNPRFSFRNYLEGWRQVTAMKCIGGLMNPVSRPGAPHDMHNRVHLWVGGVWFPRGPKHPPIQGTMALNTSDNDPVFWIHHAQIDRIWAMWEQVHGFQYAPTSGYPLGENLNDTMWPYRTVGNNVKISDLLDISKLGYTYAAP